jgi:predicted nucleic acid-binding protein
MLRVVADANVLISAALAAHRTHPRDPDDDYLVALATARHADAIVTGDPDLHAIDTEQLDIESNERRRVRKWLPETASARDAFAKRVAHPGYRGSGRRDHSQTR